MPPLEPVGYTNAAVWEEVLAWYHVVSPPSFASSPSDIDASHTDEPPLPDQLSHGGAEEGHYEEEDEEMEDEEATGEATDEPEQRSPPATTPKKRPGL